MMPITPMIMKMATGSIEESPLGLKTALSHLVIVLLMAHENDALKNRTNCQWQYGLFG